MRIARFDLFRNSALSVVSAALLLFLLEMVLRVTEAVPSRTLEYATPEMWRANPGPLRPGQTFTDRFRRGLDYRVSINQLGFRGPDLPYRKRPGLQRVLCLGDSHTFGAYVDDEETWPAQLESALHEADPDLQVEVINAGVTGFTIVDELAFLREQGLGLEPDLVVVAFVLDDLVGLTRRVPSRAMLRRSAEENAASWLGPLKSGLRQTALCNVLFLAGAWVRQAGGSGPSPQEVDIRTLLEPDLDATARALFHRYEQHLSEMRDLLAARGSPLVLVVFPYWEQVSRGAADEAQHTMLALAGRVGVLAVDLLPAFRRHDPTGRRFFHVPRDHHPSPRGYRRAALELSAALVPLLRPEPSPPPPASGLPPSAR